LITVQLHALTKRFRPRDKDAAVHDLTLTMPAGQITVLLGPSGCGKTTTLKMIAGLFHPTSGDITFDGQSVLSLPAEHRGAVMVFQNQLLFPYMTVGENVGFGLMIRRHDKAEIRRRVGAMLERVQLPGVADYRPHQLSGGQQQRVALARALIVEPQVLLLDEPLSNLDAHLRDEMRELLLSLHRQSQITTIMVTHDQQEAVVMADQIALLFAGRLRQVDAPQVFYRRPVDVQTARFFGGVNFIPGTRRDARVETDWGVFPAPEDCGVQGKCLVTIRPEDLQLNGTAPVSIDAQVVSSLYMGTLTRFKLRAGELELTAEGDAASFERFRVGGVVRIGVPADRLWLLPRLIGGGKVQQSLGKRKS